MALPTAAYSPADGICNVGSFPDSPGSSAAFRLQFQTLYDQARNFVNALKAALESTAGGTSGAENIGSKAVGAIPAGSVYSQLAALKAIADSAVAASLIPGCINNANLFIDDVVTGAKIAHDTINSENYAHESIDHEHLSEDCVEGYNIKDGAVDSGHIAGGAIDAGHFSAGAVNANALGEGAVTLGKLGSNVPRILTPDTSDIPPGDPEDYPIGTLYGWYTV